MEPIRIAVAVLCVLLIVQIIRAVRLGAFEGCDQLLRNLEDDFASIRRAAEAHRV